MREIEFRGQRVDNGEWVFGHYVKGECSYIITPELFWSTVVSVESPNHMCTFCYQVIPETVGQWTGKKDKADVKVYGGDTISISGYLYIVTWDNDSARFILKSPHDVISLDIRKVAEGVVQ